MNFLRNNYNRILIYTINCCFFNIFLIVFFKYNLESISEIYMNRSKLVCVEETLIFEPTYFIDTISILFTLLTLFLIPICILLSWDNMEVNFLNYSFIFCFLQFFLINVFCSGDLFSFYVFFEAIIIPMYLLIGILGSRHRRIHASFMFFFYTLAGSLLLLFAIITFHYQYGTTNILGLVKEDILPLKECFLWFCFFIAFAVKIPLMPVHLWLPEAHVESPTGGSVALAGILLKLGTYGILRFLLPLFPFGSQFFTPIIYLICFIGIFFGCLTTLRQIDIKKIIAYSSVIHMNFLVLGLFTFNIEGILGSIILMIAHAFVSGGLFVCVGILYDRYRTRLIKYYGGLTSLMPIFSTFFLVFTLANISFPGTFNFIGEFLVLLGLFIDNSFSAIFIIFIMILSTCYSLWLYNKLFSGLLNLYLINIKSLVSFKLQRTFFIYYSDINLREFYCLTYLLVPTIFLGILPTLFINLLEPYLVLMLNNFYND